jgi:hypothetical protein
MKVDNVRHLIPNSTVSPAKHVVQNHPAKNTSNTAQTRQLDTSQIMHQHAQVSRHQASNIAVNPKNILNMFRQRRLGDRSLSRVDGGHNGVPEMHPDELEAVFGLLNGGKAKPFINIQIKKLLKRFGQVKSIIDSNYEPENDDEKRELQNVKRKTTSTVKKEHVRDAIEEMIGKDPANAYILIENTKQELGLIGPNAKDPKNYTQFDKAIIEFSKDNYATHGVKIRADINIANEIADVKNKTQFKEWYYAIIQEPSLLKLKEIRSICANHLEFMGLTNLMARAAAKDRDGEKAGRLPVSCPNTIHDVISVMDKRSKLDSLHHAIIRFKRTLGSIIDVLNGKEKPLAQTGGTLVEYTIPQRLKSKT